MLEDLNLGSSLIELETYPHDLTDADLLSYDFDFYLVVGIHSLNDTPRRFCVHPCGNWGEKWTKSNITLGGKENTLSMTSASFLNFVHKSLLKNNDLKNYAVSIEATHHGPNVSKPILMLEIGANSNAWTDEFANQVLVNVVLDVLNNFKQINSHAMFILGGDHYMNEITSVLNDSDFFVGHMCPSSQIYNFNKSLLNSVIEKTYEKINLAIIDLAGVGQHVLRLINILDDANVEYIYLHELIN
jgi:D-aminoacyl-tRNA deacylase